MFTAEPHTYNTHNAHEAEQTIREAEVVTPEVHKESRWLKITGIATVATLILVAASIGIWFSTQDVDSKETTTTKPTLQPTPTFAISPTYYPPTPTHGHRPTSDPTHPTPPPSLRPSPTTFPTRFPTFPSPFPTFPTSFPTRLPTGNFNGCNCQTGFYNDGCNDCVCQGGCGTKFCTFKKEPRCFGTP